MIDKKLLRFLAPKVERIEIWNDILGHVVLERGLKPKKNWMMLAPKPAHANPQTITQLLFTLGALEGDEIEMEGKGTHGKKVMERTGLKKPKQRVLFFGASKEVPFEILSFGEQENGFVYAAANRRDIIFRVRTGRLDLFPKTIDALIQKR